MTITDPRPADLVTVPKLHSLAGPASPAAAAHSISVVVAPQWPNSRSTEHTSTSPEVASGGPNSRAATGESTPLAHALREPNSHATGALSIPEPVASREPNSRPAKERTASRATSPVGSISRAAGDAPTPKLPALRETNSHATHAVPVSEEQASRGPNSRSAMTGTAPADSSPGGAQVTDRRNPSDARSSTAVGVDGAQDRAAVADSLPGQASLLDPALALAADFLDDIERVKIANENRLRSLTRIGTDADGVDRYVGLSADHPVVEQLAKMVASLAEVEHAATLNLQRMVRKHPLGPWIKATKGVGEKQGARLLAVIGDPYWRPEITRADGTVIPEGPRTVSALWAYCGLHVLPGDRGALDAQLPYVAGDQAGAGGDSGQRPFDAQGTRAGVAARRRKGQQANWSTKAKMRAYLIAESSMKTIRQPCEPNHHAEDCGCSPYRLVYDRRKAHTAASRPDWTDGHRHADALRVASKEVLKDLWRAGRDWHAKQRGETA